VIPVAILCGGYGRRSALPINKCFVDVAGRPFILHIMEQYEAQGFTTFVLCRGTGGTLTALRNAREQLGEKFIVNYGDTYTSLNFRDFITRWENSKSASITALYDNIDAGVNGFYTHTLDMLEDSVTDLSVLQKELKSRGMVCRYESPLPWHEVGVPSALAETRAFFA